MIHLPARVLALGRFAFLLFVFGSLLARASAAPMTLDQLNKNVWKRIYHLTANTDDPAWLAKDDDGDGITNGDEIRAGTDPESAGSTVQITSTTVSSGKVHLTFKTVKGKLYRVLQSSNLSNPSGWAEVSPPSRLMGTNAAVTLDATFTANTFYRISVEDVDTDGDGLSDWAEMKLGLDPSAAQSSSAADSFGRFLADNEYATNNFNQENVVNVSSISDDASATQPDAGQSATDLGNFTVSRAGLPTVLVAVTVNVTIGGTAIPGTDYTPLPATVVIPAGVRSLLVPVVPLPNGSRRSAVTVTMAINAGAGYLVGSGSVAGVTILPSGTTPSGTGLTGSYYNGFSTTYTSTTNFKTTSLVATRVDPTVDFTWSTTSPAAAALPSGVGTSYCIRWSGQVQPQYAETYTFHVRSRRGCVLYIGGTKVIDAWPGSATNTTTAVDYTGTADLQAGVRYDIQLDYLSGANTGANTSETHLSWYSISQPEVVIPSTRLYPSTLDPNSSGPPSITSASAAYGFVNQSFSFDVTTSSNSASTTVSLLSGTLPPGLTFTQTALASGVKVGRISGTTAQAGDYQLTVGASNAAGSSSAALDLQILDSGNGLTKEVWTNLPAGTINDIPTATTPNVTSFLTSLEDTQTGAYAGNYGERIRGYVSVPSTGYYYFYVAANDVAEFWLSPDSELVSKLRRSTTTGGQSRAWGTQAKQRSGWLQLNAGVKYYLEVLHRGSDSSNHHLSIGFVQDPTGTADTSTTAATATVLPGYLLWQYYSPPVAYTSDSTGGGRLYFTKMAAQGTALTGASGLCTMRLSADETQAIVKFSYSGLTTAVTGKHIHNDQYLNHPSSIIFDMDVAQPQPDGSYVWNIVPVGTFTNIADIQQLIREGKSYINVHTVNYPAGEIRGNLTIADGAQNFVPPANAHPTFALPSAPSVTEASRFLTQASFGPNPADLATVRASGFPAWIDAQVALTPSHATDYTQDTRNVVARYPENQTFNAIWRNAISGTDQLRQRVAFALSQILVTSAIGPLDNNSRGLSSYYDCLVDNGLGNYRDLLKAVTLHSTMGTYLDMLGNRNGDLTSGRIPNENYGREILQLFSIGLNRLWPDGTLVLDSKFSPVPTYDQNVIIGFARTFTGWNYNQPNQANGRLPTSFGTTPGNPWIVPMSLFPTDSGGNALHELGSKHLLGNVYLPPAAVTDANTTATDTDSTSPYFGVNLYDRNGLKDLDDAIDIIFNHPNVGPFICRQLIQRLVTSQPSAGYLYRVVQAFQGEKTWDGRVTGVRGDLLETVKAILLDYEARSSDLLTDPTYGKQREPILRVTAPARYFLSKAVTGTFTQSSAYDSVTNPYPHRMKIDLTGDVLIAQDEYTALTFKSPLTTGAIAPPSTIGSTTYYRVRTTPTFEHGSAPRTNPSFFVDAFGVVGADYSWTNKTVTLTGVLSSLDNSDPRVSVGSSVYLKFFGANAPPSAIYTVATAPGGNTFTVTTAATATGTVTGPAMINEIANSSYSINSNHSVVNILTPLPHGLAVGQQIYILDKATNSVPITGRYTVVTVPDPQKFTINASGTGTSTASINPVVIFPLIAPPVDRSGTILFTDSTWQMNVSDGESTTASVTQTPMRSPTVFNYYYPDYSFPGDLALNGITTPEFQLTADTTIMLLSNFLEQGIYTGAGTDGRSAFRNGAIQIDMSPYVTPAYTSNSGVGSLVDKLNLEMMGGTMSTDVRNAIVAYVGNTANFSYTTTAPTDTQMRNRVRAVVQLVISSTEFAIQR